MNKKLAQVVVNEMNKKAETSLLKQIDENTWEYSNGKYDFIVQKYTEDQGGMYLVDVFDHEEYEKTKDSNKAIIDGEDAFLSLEEVEEYIKFYK